MLRFFQTLALFFYKNISGCFFHIHSGGGLLENFLPLSIRTSYGVLCLSNQQFVPSGSFRMTTTSKGWRDGGNGLAITNNKHAPKIYSKLYLIEYNINEVST